MGVRRQCRQHFQRTFGNIVSTSHPEDGDEEMIQSDTDPCIKHLNTLWDIHFEQREPPTEDKVTQINLGDEANPKPIFISESLSPSCNHLEGVNR